MQYWSARAGDTRIDRIDFEDRSSRPKRVPNRTDDAIEQRILELRALLQRESVLGEFGAEAIHRHLLEEKLPLVPSTRTINRVLERHGQFDQYRRVRRTPPPSGWYLPQLASRACELDSFDVIEGLLIRNGPEALIFTAVSLHGRLRQAWPLARSISARDVTERLIEHWQAEGLPRYAQFDNDTRFQGPHQHRDVISRVMRLCLSLGVTPVFAPPRESGFQAAIESFNGLWQQKVWARFEHASLQELQDRSQRYIVAARARLAQTIEAAPPRSAWPQDWQLDLQAHPRGTVIYIRRTGDNGGIFLLGRHFDVDPHWIHRLVRCEVDLTRGQIDVFALSRREPSWQPKLIELEYELPRRRFAE